MSRNSARIKALAAFLALYTAQGWGQNLSVESRTVAPDEAFTIAVNLTGGANTAAGVNLRLTGQGSGLNASDGLTAGAGSIYNGHSPSTNVLSSLNDFRAVIYNSGTTTNFTGDGLLHTLSGRVASTATNGTTIPFNFDAAGTAVANSAGAVLSATTTNGLLTVSTPFPQTTTFDGGTDNWTYFDQGAAPPEQNFFEFNNAFESTANQALGVINLEYRSLGTWTAPDSIAPHYRDNVVAHVFNLNTNKTSPYLLNDGTAVPFQTSGSAPTIDFRVRGTDVTLFHTVPEYGVSPGRSSPRTTPTDYVMFIDRPANDDATAPSTIKPVFDATHFLNSNLVTSDIAFQFNNYRNVRMNRSALLASSTAVNMQGYNLDRVDGNLNVYVTTAQDFDFDGMGNDFNLTWNPFWLESVENGFGVFFSKPNHFYTEGGAGVFGFEKPAGQTADLDRFGLFGKTAVGVQVAANTMYVAEFTVNTDIADTINAPNFRVRTNIIGAAPSGQEGDGTYNEVFVQAVNTVVLLDINAQPITTMPQYPRPGQPSVVRVFLKPHPQSVGGDFQFSFDYNEVFAPQLNTAAGRVWLSGVQLRAITQANADAAIIEGASIF